MAVVDGVTFWGLRSRWTTPCSWALASASAIFDARGTASGAGSAPCLHGPLEARALDELHRDEGRSVFFIHFVRPPQTYG